MNQHPARLAVVLPLLIAIDLLSCSTINKSHEQTDPWLHYQPEGVYTSDSEKIDTANFHSVKERYRLEAEGKLDSQAAITITSAKAAKYAATLKPRANNLKPYLIRCVSFGSPDNTCSVYRKSSQLLVSCAILSHHTPEFKHSPLVVYLDFAPSTVDVTASIVE